MGEYETKFNRCLDQCINTRLSNSKIGQETIRRASLGLPLTKEQEAKYSREREGFFGVVMDLIHNNVYKG